MGSKGNYWCCNTIERKEILLAIISPSILSSDFLNLESEFQKLNKLENIWIHLDIMDGHFVPNMTFGIPFIERFSQISQRPLDAHFMVTNPRFYLEKLRNVNLHNFTFHIETEPDPLNFIFELKKVFPSVGVSLRPSTDFKFITEEILKAIDLLLIMSVEPGFGGQKFIDSTWERLDYFSALKEKFNFQIQIDGGVSNQNAKELERRGVDNLVAGSYLFNKNSTLNEMIQKLYE